MPCLFVAAAACACGVLLACSNSHRQTDRARTLQVSSHRAWQETGITVRAGQTLILRNITGRISDRETTIDGGGGTDYVCGSPACCEPMPNERRSALIARVGTDTFLVGNGTEHVSRSEGPLLLRINDCDEGLSDNGGTLFLELAVSGS